MPGGGFVRLDTDADATEQEIVLGVLAALDRADAVYFYNPGGYLGASTAVEMGYCLAAGKRFYTLAEPADEGHRAYAAGPIATPEEVVADLRAMPLHERLSERGSLPALQRYVAEMVERRGFTPYKTLEVMLLLVEEVGELAKALRKLQGLKIDGVDLAAALKQKEAQNERRVWKA